MGLAVRACTCVCSCAATLLRALALDFICFRNSSGFFCPSLGPTLSGTFPGGLAIPSLPPGTEYFHTPERSSIVDQLERSGHCCSTPPVDGSSVPGRHISHAASGSESTYLVRWRWR